MGTVLASNACVDCSAACERCTPESCLRCRDDFVLVDGVCVEKDATALLVSSNNTLRCAESFFSDNKACWECPASCLSCNDESTCSVCAAGTSLSQDGACVGLEDATVQTHNGAVACDDTFVVSGRVCESCADRFDSVCPSCSVCDSDGCVRCDGDVVFENGAWRASQHCARADGTVCQECADGAVFFNATDCVPADDCAVYENGRCVQCRDQRVVFTDGTCVGPEFCSDRGDGICLRCTAGMFADEDGACHRLLHTTPHPQRATRRARRARSTRRSARHATQTPGCS